MQTGAFHCNWCRSMVKHLSCPCRQSYNQISVHAQVRCEFGTCCMSSGHVTHGHRAASLESQHAPCRPEWSHIPPRVCIFCVTGPAPSLSATKRARHLMPLPHISGSLPSELYIRMV